MNRINIQNSASMARRMLAPIAGLPFYTGKKDYFGRAHPPWFERLRSPLGIVLSFCNRQGMGSVELQATSAQLGTPREEAIR
jgi:hypothetical protein